MAENRLATYSAYTRQKDFHAAGATHRERLFRAGNQLGKSLSGSAEMAMHLTGRYPDWWQGRRWDRPVVVWAGGPTSETTRDNCQRLLIGREGSRGTGMIPAACIDECTSARGVAGLIDYASIKHESGGLSQIKFKYYEQGREKWQGETVDIVWFDEEPPLDIYTEGLTRTNATGGMVYLTATPLLGMSEVVMRFVTEESPHRADINMTIADVGHISPEERERIIESYPAHEREARTKGIPMLGSGRIYPVTEELIAADPIDIPRHWPQIAALDFGWDHPTAAVRLAWDRDTDTVWVTACHRAREMKPLDHAAKVKAWGDWLPWAWPHDGLSRGRGGDAPLAEQYRGHGLRMMDEPASFDGGGGNSVEAGIMDLLERMETGRFKVFRHLNDWFEEFRLYHRKNGRPTEERDDLMDATRYAVMCLRKAKTKPSGVVRRPHLGFVT